MAEVLVLKPSPKSQKRFVMSPVDRSLKLRVKGFKPRVGLAEKFAESGSRPTPVTGLVLEPPSPKKMTALLELLLLLGLKLTTRLVEPNGGRLKGVPETILKGPVPMLAVPLVRAAPPIFVRTKLA